MRGALLPLAWLFRGGVALRNRHYDRPEAVTRVERPVISIGNLSVGGTGKTPLVALVARRLQQRGLTVAIVSRGYGGEAGRGPLTVSTGEGPIVGPELSGDEPAELAAALPGAIVVVGSDRVAGAREAIALGARLIVLDDGFQHRRLARDLDIVLVDSRRPLDEERLLPAGDLREPPASLARADLIVATRCTAETPLPDWLGARAGEIPIVRAGTRVRGFRRGEHEVEAPERAVALCGIAGPERFRAALAETGVELLAFEALADHAPIPPATLARLTALAAEQNAELVVTAKDRARLGRLPAGSAEPLVLAIEAEIHDGAPLAVALEALLARAVD